ncbi:expansin-like protein [Striga asiatica]|uniref:Expansin-like protein n=1 Tax=Striga asiatica TaxID=4170 RepID=A0A5A7PRL7_STRAF|nr:expansin-like protein [Striga asiatica]
MGIKHEYNLMFSKYNIVYLVLVASLCYGDDGYICSRATYYGSPDCLGNPRGACGFGEYGRTVNNGLVSGVSRLYRNGSGCGACYQVRCKIPSACTEDGIKIVVTDYGEGHDTDFILTARAYASLASSPDAAAHLLDYGVVDVEYRRVPCQFGSSNLLLKVHEHSSYPSYLAVVPLYQGGAYDVTGAQVWVEECKEWRAMRRVYGTVWDMENPPLVIANIRFQLSTGDQFVKWVELLRVIPNEWKAGVVYDTGLQLV